MRDMVESQPDSFDLQKLQQVTGRNPGGLRSNSTCFRGSALKAQNKLWYLNLIF